MLKQTIFLCFLTTMMVACKGFSHKKKFHIDEKKRLFIIDLPKNIKADKEGKSDTTNSTRPVIYVLHGNPTSAYLMRKYTGLEKATKTNDFIIVHLSAQNNRWPYTFDTSRIHNETTYIDRVIETVDSTYNTDTSQRYLAGFSAGGFFISHLLSQSKNDFHGVALIGSTLLKDSLLHFKNNLMPWLLVIGTEDPFYIGTHFSQSAKSSVKSLVQTNNCSEIPICHRYNDTFKRDSSSVHDNLFSSPAGNHVWYVEITNGGHHWPNATINPNFLFPKTDLGNLNRDFDTNKYLIEFFKNCSSRSVFNTDLQRDSANTWNSLE